MSKPAASLAIPAADEAALPRSSSERHGVRAKDFVLGSSVSLGCAGWRKGWPVAWEGGFFIPAGRSAARLAIFPAVTACPYILSEVHADAPAVLLEYILPEPVS